MRVPYCKQSSISRLGHDISTTQDAEELYGFSTWLCDYIVQHQVAVLKPREVVDFGAGAGKNGRLVRGALGDAS